MEQLIKTIQMVKKRLNRNLMIDGILLTMVDFRTNYAKDIALKLRETYGMSVMRNRYLLLKTDLALWT